MTVNKEDGKTERFALAHSRRFILDKLRKQKTRYRVALLLNFISCPKGKEKCVRDEETRASSLFGLLVSVSDSNIEHNSK